MPTDYGEPLAAKTYHDRGGEFYMTADRDGRSLFEMRDGPLDQFKTFRMWAEQEAIRLRLVRCVNLLAGVPDADPVTTFDSWHGRYREEVEAECLN